MLCQRSRRATTFEFLPVTNRTAGVEACGFKQVDFVLTGPGNVVMRIVQSEGSSRFFPPWDYSLLNCHFGRKRFLPRLRPCGEAGRHGHVGFSTFPFIWTHYRLLADVAISPMDDLDIVHYKGADSLGSHESGTVAAVAFEPTPKFADFASRRWRGGLQPWLFGVHCCGRDLPNDLLMPVAT